MARRKTKATRRQLSPDRIARRALARLYLTGAAGDLEAILCRTLAAMNNPAPGTDMYERALVLSRARAYEEAFAADLVLCAIRVMRYRDCMQAHDQLCADYRALFWRASERLDPAVLTYVQRACGPDLGAVREMVGLARELGRVAHWTAVAIRRTCELASLVLPPDPTVDGAARIVARIGARGGAPFPA